VPVLSVVALRVPIVASAPSTAAFTAAAAHYIRPRSLILNRLSAAISFLID